MRFSKSWARLVRSISSNPDCISAGTTKRHTCSISTGVQLLLLLLLSLPSASRCACWSARWRSCTEGAEGVEEAPLVLAVVVVLLAVVEDGAAVSGAAGKSASMRLASLCRPVVVVDCCGPFTARAFDDGGGDDGGCNVVAVLGGGLRDGGVGAVTVIT